jgi:hypothetical protein
MLIIKISTLVLIAAITIYVLIKNTKSWSSRFQQHMLGQTQKVFGSAEGWDGSWGKIMSMAMVIFFGFMFIVFAYGFIFSL